MYVLKSVNVNVYYISLKFTIYAFGDSYIYSTCLFNFLFQNVDSDIFEQSPYMPTATKPVDNAYS